MQSAVPEEVATTNLDFVKLHNFFSKFQQIYLHKKQNQFQYTYLNI